MTNEDRFFEKLFGGIMMTLSERSRKEIRVRSDSPKTAMSGLRARYLNFFSREASKSENFQCSLVQEFTKSSKNGDWWVPAACVARK